MSPSFSQHPQRQTLNDEVHTRAPMMLHSPEAVSYLAFLHHEGSAGREPAHVAAFAAQLGLPEPDCSSGQVILDAGDFRFRWSRHNEFSSYTFFRHIDSPDEAPDDHALRKVPAAWCSAIPGQLVVATHVMIRPDHEFNAEALVAKHLAGEAPMVVSQISSGAGWVFTDFHIHADGFSRFLVVNHSLTPRQTGRTVQRLVELETYRLIALLSFPVAKEVARLLSRAEDDLSDLVQRMLQCADDAEGEHRLLGHLTRLAADVEQSVATTTYRFDAGAAYYRLIKLRIEEMRELRVTGFPTLQEFMDRRLMPAMETCATIAQRQEELSHRIARNAQLLRTRVEVELQRQNQQVLEQMNRRARLQLRLQETVEGLSVVAITYYGSQLVHYFSKGIQPQLAPLTSEIITAMAIPLIAGCVFLSLRRMRKRLASEEKQN